MRGCLLFVLMFSGLACRGPASQFESTAATFEFGDAGSDPPEPPPNVTVTGCWSPPIVLAPSSSWAKGSMVVLPSGDALVAWLEDSVNPRVLARSVFLDGGLGDIEVIYAAPVAPFLAHRIDDVVLHNSSGEREVVASWIHSADAGAVYEVRTSTRHGDGGWSSSERINTELSRQIVWLDVRPDAKGQRFAVWRQGTESIPDGLRFRRSFTDGGWSPEAALTPDGTVLTSDPSLEVSPDGYAVLTWQGYYPPILEPAVHATLLHPDRWVDTSLGLIGGGFVSTPSTLALARDGGQAVVVWNAVDVGALDSRLRADNWESAAQFAPVDAGMIAMSPVASIDDLGFVTALWGTWTSLEEQIWSAHENGSGWSAPELLDVVSRPTFILHATNGSERALSAWARGTSLLVRRTDVTGAQLDTIDGLIVAGSRNLPVVLVGDSGARWILATVSESGWRAVAFVCP